MFLTKRKNEFSDQEMPPCNHSKEVKINIKNVLLTPMPYLCLALPLSRHTGTHGVQKMLNKKICESLGNNFRLTLEDIFGCLANIDLSMD
jgi:hypothetical protein